MASVVPATPWMSVFSCQLLSMFWKKPSLHGTLNVTSLMCFCLDEAKEDTGMPREEAREEVWGARGTRQEVRDLGVQSGVGGAAGPPASRRALSFLGFSCGPGCGGGEACDCSGFSAREGRCGRRGGGGREGKGGLQWFSVGEKWHFRVSGAGWARRASVQRAVGWGRSGASTQAWGVLLRGDRGPA